MLALAVRQLRLGKHGCRQHQQDVQFGSETQPAAHATTFNLLLFFSPFSTTITSAFSW
jgi:hypothetical protein